MCSNNFLILYGLLDTFLPLYIHSFIFFCSVSFRLWGVLEPIPDVLGFTLDASPIHHRAPSGQTIIHTYGQFREVGSPKLLNVLGLREDTGESKENPCRHGANMQTLHRRIYIFTLLNKSSTSFDSSRNILGLRRYSAVNLK